MHRETKTLRSAPFLNPCYSPSGHPKSFLLLIPTLTLHLNKKTTQNLVHAFRLSKALQLYALLNSKTLHRRCKKFRYETRQH